MKAEKLLIADNQIVYDGDRVYGYDFGYKRIYGTIHFSELDDFWFVNYDDGEDFIVIAPHTIFKA